MSEQDSLRPGELSVAPPKAGDAGLEFIGRIHTPWANRADCPRHGKPDGPLCRIELFEPWALALQGIEAYARLEVLYWLDRARRDLVQQSPKNDGRTLGSFALRSPLRPNPIGTAVVVLESRQGNSLLVRGLDCLDGTPLLDLKPEYCPFSGAGNAGAANPRG
ncbi:tRNA (N6-threonylcarbamoyladenosine(37)-N6)-methyltransferase TrmO [Ferrovibrio sp.]|uniref:tRNA (N6-threonylcarbamoyladenosine(37)-N6)-methyltransferase TrmO n=1 Tax=Ferrovibrio sp. TaxID=1917215 RepID=UPI003D0C5AA7